MRRNMRACRYKSHANSGIIIIQDRFTIFRQRIINEHKWSYDHFK